MSTFVNNDVSSGDVVYASDHNTQGALLAAVINGGLDNNNLSASAAISTSKLADDAGVTTAKLADGAVTSAKLAEAFLRGKYQSNTTNSAPTGLTIQHGWGFVLGDGDSVATESVTFPSAFTTLHSITCCALGSKSGSDPSSISDFNTTSITANPGSPSTAGFTAVVGSFTGSSFSSSVRLGYSWIAIGII